MPYLISLLLAFLIGFARGLLESDLQRRFEGRFDPAPDNDSLPPGNQRRFPQVPTSRNGD